MSNKNNVMIEELKPTLSNFKKDLAKQGYLKSPLKKSSIMSLRDFLIFSTSLMDEYLSETKKKTNFQNLMSFLPGYLEKKFKFSTNNRAQISDFITNFMISLENFVATSKEVEVFNSFLLQETISPKKLAFYLKARKTISTYLYYYKLEPGDLDTIELNLGQWPTLTSRMFNEFKNFDEILKLITERVKSLNEKNPAIQKKNTINAMVLLEIWLEFFDKFKKFFACSPNKSGSAKKEENPEKQQNINQNNSSVTFENSPKTLKKSKKDDSPMIKSFFCPPDSYYKEMMECEENNETGKENIKDREEKFLKNYMSNKPEDANIMGKSMISLMEGETEKLGEFLKQDGNKFKVLNMILRMIGECEVLLQEFADVLAYFKHLKEYVSYISKDKTLTEKIKTYQLPNFEETTISKKINFCKKFIQEYITSLEYVTFSKASFAEFGPFGKSLADITAIRSPHKETTLNESFKDIDKKILQRNDSSENPSESDCNKSTKNENSKKKPDFNMEDALNKIISDYLNTLNSKVLEEIFEQSAAKKEIEKEQNEKIEEIPFSDRQSIKANSHNRSSIKKEDTPQSRQSIKKEEIPPPKQFTIKINDQTETVVNITEKQGGMPPDVGKSRRGTQEEMEIEKLKLGDDLTEKINKIIFNDIKTDEIMFLQRKISQEFGAKRHSVHYQQIGGNFAAISKSRNNNDEKNHESSVKSRRSSSIESIRNSSHKKSNESPSGMSKFNRMSSKSTSKKD